MYIKQHIFIGGTYEELGGLAPQILERKGRGGIDWDWNEPAVFRLGF